MLVGFVLGEENEVEIVVGDVVLFFVVMVVCFGDDVGCDVCFDVEDWFDVVFFVFLVEVYGVEEVVVVGKCYGVYVEFFDFGDEWIDVVVVVE